MNDKSGRFRILIVDDEKDIRENIKEALSEEFIIDTAGSREDAFKRFKDAYNQNF